MINVTLDDVRRILISCAGDLETSDLSGDISDLEFDDLGYDSLALLETAARIKQELGVHIPDDRITELRTPRELLDMVNGSTAGVSR